MANSVSKRLSKSTKSDGRGLPQEGGCLCACVCTKLRPRTRKEGGSSKLSSEDKVCFEGERVAVSGVSNVWFPGDLI